MTLVTRSAIRLSKRGGQALRNQRANAALFNSAANQASKVIPALARVETPRVKLAAKQGEWMPRVCLGALAFPSGCARSTTWNLCFSTLTFSQRCPLLRHPV